MDWRLQKGANQFENELCIGLGRIQRDHNISTGEGRDEHYLYYQEYHNVNPLIPHNFIQLLKHLFDWLHLLIDLHFDNLKLKQKEQENK